MRMGRGALTLRGDDEHRRRDDSTGDATANPRSHLDTKRPRVYKSAYGASDGGSNPPVAPHSSGEHKNPCRTRPPCVDGVTKPPRRAALAFCSQDDRLRLPADQQLEQREAA